MTTAYALTLTIRARVDAENRHAAKAILAGQAKEIADEMPDSMLGPYAVAVETVTVSEVKGPREVKK